MAEPIKPTNYISEVLTSLGSVVVSAPVRGGQTFFKRPIITSHPIPQNLSRDAALLAPLCKRLGSSLKAIQSGSANGRQQCSDIIPSASNSALCGLNGNFQLSTPFRDGLGAVINSDVVARPSVVTLLDTGTPLTVGSQSLTNTFLALATRIPTVIINTVNRVFTGWSFAHISSESKERGVPSIAHPNASTSIIRKRAILGIKAPRFHSRPSAIGRCIGLAMYRRALTGHFTAQTSATLGTPTAEHIRRCEGSTAAFTQTVPHCAELAVIAQTRWGTRGHGQASKSLSGQINAFKKSDRISVGHYKNLLTRFKFWLGSDTRTNGCSGPYLYFTTPSHVTGVTL